MLQRHWGFPQFGSSSSLVSSSPSLWSFPSDFFCFLECCSSEALGKPSLLSPLLLALLHESHSSVVRLLQMAQALPCYYWRFWSRSSVRIIIIRFTACFHATPRSLTPASPLLPLLLCSVKGKSLSLPISWKLLNVA